MYIMRLALSLVAAAILAGGARAFVPSNRITPVSTSIRKNNYGNRNNKMSSTSTSMGLSDDIIGNVNLNEIGTAAKSILETTPTTLASLDAGSMSQEPLILPDISLPTLSIGEGLSMGDLSIPPEVNDAINDFIAWAQPQIEALADYVVADLSEYWDQYVAALEARDSATIVGTGWGGLILVLILANTAARGGSEDKRLAAFEAAQAAKEEEEARLALKKKSFGGGGRGGGLGAFGKSAASSSSGGPSRLQQRLDKQAAAAKRRAEVEAKKREARLVAKAKANKAAFDKKQKEKKRKEEARKKILKADFKKRQGLGKNRTRK